jgi:hypothetical protein
MGHIKVRSNKQGFSDTHFQTNLSHTVANVPEWYSTIPLSFAASQNTVILFCLFNQNMDFGD